MRKKELLMRYQDLKKSGGALRCAGLRWQGRPHWGRPDGHVLL
jgi:hypothetical protein